MREINITFGTNNQGVILVMDNERRGYSYYVQVGGTIVNQTYDTITEGMNIDEINDSHCLSSKEGINTLEELEDFLNN